jgi:hypothetical protein
MTSHHDALPAAVGNRDSRAPFRQLVRPDRNRASRSSPRVPIEAEFDEALARSRYARRVETVERRFGGDGGRHKVIANGQRSRALLGTFERMEIEMPRARLNTPDGKTTECKSRTLRAYQRRTLAADTLIDGCYRALGALFAGAVGKHTVSRVWRKVKSDWDAWNARSLALRHSRHINLMPRAQSGRTRTCSTARPRGPRALRP